MGPLNDGNKLQTDKKKNNKKKYKNPLNLYNIKSFRTIRYTGNIIHETCQIFTAT